MYPIDNLCNLKRVNFQIEIYRNHWYLNTGIFYVDQDTSLFCKVDLSSLDPEERLSSFKMHLNLSMFDNSFDVEVYRLPINDFSRINLIGYTQSDLNNLEVIDSQIIKFLKSDNSNLGSATVDLDLMNLFLNNNSNIAIFLIKFNTVALVKLDLDCLNNSSTLKLFSGIVTNSYGLNSINKFDSLNFDSLGDFSINLFTGNLFYKNSLLNTNSHNFKASLSIISTNSENSNFTSYLNSPFYFDYQLKANIVSGIFFLTNSTLARSEYLFFDLTEENALETLDRLGITDITRFENLYISYSDLSYIGKLCNEDGYLLCDKTGNSVKFIISDLGEVIILYKEDISSKRVTYYYDDSNNLIRICDPDLDNIYISYDNSKITLAAIPSRNEFIEISSLSNRLSLKLYQNNSGIISNVDDYVRGDIVRSINIVLSNGKISEITNTLTNEKVQITYNNENFKVASIKHFINTNKVIDEFFYEFGNCYASVYDHFGYKIIYKFSYDGYIANIIDSKSNCSTINYSLIDEYGVKRVNSIGDPKPNSKNKLYNHSFEKETEFTQNSFWEKSSDNSIATVVNGGFYGTKCLKLISDPNSLTTFRQKIEKNSNNIYYLHGFLKCNNLNAIRDGKVKIGIYLTCRVVSDKINEIDGTSTPNIEIKTYSKEASLRNTSSWQEFTISPLILPNNTTLLNGYVTLTVDNIEAIIRLDEIQLLDNNFNTRTNFIDNGYFEKSGNSMPFGWSGENLISDDKSVAANSPGILNLGDSAFRFSKNNHVIINNRYKKRRIWQNITISGGSEEEFLLIAHGLGMVSENTIFRAYLTFNYEDGTNSTHYFDFSKHFNSWQTLQASFISNKNYISIVVGIEYDGVNTVYIDGIQLYKDNFGKYLRYDNKGNLVETVNSGGIASINSYDSKNRITNSFSSDGNFYKLSYGDNGKINKITDLYNNSVTLTYSGGDVSQTRYLTNEGELIFQNNNNKYNKTITNIDEFNHQVVTYYDELERPTRIIENDLNTYYGYDSLRNLRSIRVQKGNEARLSTITYNNFLDVSTLTAPSNNKYIFEYDQFLNLLNVKSENFVYESYEYNYDNTFDLQQISTKNVNDSSNKYTYDYYEDGSLKNISINNSVILDYKYDENGNIYEEKDRLRNVNSYFTYDLSSRLIQNSFSNGDCIKYFYDNQNKINKKIINSSLSFDYDYGYEINEYKLCGYYNRLIKLTGDDVVIGNGNGDSIFGLKVIDRHISSSIDSETKFETLTFSKNIDFVTYDLTSTNDSRRYSSVKNGLSYEEWKDKFNTQKSFLMRIKPCGSFEPITIISFKYGNPFSAGTIIGSLSITEQGKIRYSLENGQSICTSSQELNLNTWNLIVFCFYTESSSNLERCKIFLNNNETLGSYVNHTFSDINKFTVGSNKIGDHNLSESNLDLSYKIGFLMVGSYDYSENEVKAIYHNGLFAFSNYNVNEFSATHFYNPFLFNGYDVITLNGSLESTKGNIPVKISERNNFSLNKSRIFKYEKTIKKYVFGSFSKEFSLMSSDKNYIAYDFEFLDSCSVFFRYKMEEECEKAGNSKRTFFAFVKNNETIFSFSYRKNGIIDLILNGQTINNLFSLNYEWSDFAFIYHDSTLKIYFNGVLTISRTIEIDFSDSVFYLGSNPLENDSEMNGYFEMLTYKNGCSTDSDIFTLHNKSKMYSIKSTKDNLGRLVSKEIVTTNGSINKIYSYHKTKIIGEANQSFGINYEYTSLNQISHKKYLGFCGNEVDEYYSYNNFNELSGELRSDSKEAYYTYDANGNIKTKQIRSNNQVIENYQYFYDGNFKNRLSTIIEEVSGTQFRTFTYGTNGYHTLLSFTKNGVSYPITYEGNRILSLGNITLNYDGHGNRIRKTYVESNEPINVFYEYYEDKLISIHCNSSSFNYQFNYIYDESDSIVGFFFENSTYFYIRDITNNIIGIVDESNNFIVKYFYDAWGNLINKLVLIDNGVSRYNHILYKGYLFDVEVGLYWCKTRFYDPQIGRFLTCDNSNYLNPECINGLNPYTYCGNDPVNKWDPSGNFAMSIGVLFVIGGVIGTSIGAASSIAGQYFANGCSWENFSWGQLALDTFLGGVSGVLSMSTLGLLSMIGVNAGIGFIGAFGGHLINGSNFSNFSTWADIILSTILGVLVGVVGGRGALNPISLKAGKPTASFVRAIGLYDDILTKAVTGFYRTPGIASNALRLSGMNLVKQRNKMILGQSGKNLARALAFGGSALLIGTAGKGKLYDLYKDNF